jgi:hypothetical protein
VLILGVVLLFLIWRSVANVSTSIATQTKSAAVYLQQLDDRLADIEARIRDNFQTEDERDDEAMNQP